VLQRCFFSSVRSRHRGHHCSREPVEMCYRYSPFGHQIEYACWPTNYTVRISIIIRTAPLHGIRLVMCHVWQFDSSIYFHESLESIDRSIDWLIDWFANYRKNAKHRVMSLYIYIYIYNKHNNCPHELTIIALHLESRHCSARSCAPWISTWWPLTYDRLCRSALSQQLDRRINASPFKTTFPACLF